MKETFRSMVISSRQTENNIPKFSRSIPQDSLSNTSFSHLQAGRGIRESVMKKGVTKKRTTADANGGENPSNSNNSSTATTHNTSNQSHCSCGTICSTKRCGCKKQGEFCSDQCRCPPGCVNKKIDEKSLKEAEGDVESGDQEMADDKENAVQNSSGKEAPRSLEKRKSQDDSSDASAEDHTPKRIKYVALMIKHFNRVGY